MTSPNHSSNDEEANPLTVGEEFVQSPNHLAPTTSSIDLDGLLNPPLQLQQDLKEGCGGQLWPAGVVLAKYLLRKKRDDLKEKTILELGAGGGLVGLAIALSIPLTHPLHITDQSPMLPLMRQNILLNDLSPTVQAHILDWSTAISTAPPQPDILLAADCVYFEPAFPLLLETMQRLIGPATVCYFCFKKRRRADLGFVRRARKMFVVRGVEDDPDKGVWEREGLFLYEIRKRTA
ncbi:MAG: S-adenosyl-L-methionine-dependent methyltransferase [Lasallia pustulata]|uniref:Protein-lysine N-methyltransferase EFM6 n=1 Tax=Lasallia pustulata TaxID=136370 RepID=A0A5M8PMW4_9LECA|nr:MAG: S-adenosyl-L-methionine-dependent methyltransferase [Lasallia pustulata]